jgi:hypothetical protein
VTEDIEVTTRGSITPTLRTGLHLRAGQAQDDSYTEYGLDRHLSRFLWLPELTLLSRIAPRAGLVTLGQTFVHRAQSSHSPGDRDWLGLDGRHSSRFLLAACIVGSDFASLN